MKKYCGFHLHINIFSNLAAQKGSQGISFSESFINTGRRQVIVSFFLCPSVSPHRFFVLHSQKPCK